MHKYDIEMNPNDLIEKVAKILGTSFEEIAYSMPPTKVVELLVKEFEKKNP